MSKTSKKSNKKQSSRKFFRRNFDSLNERRKKFLSKRPHRSFRLTHRKYYKRSLDIPGYISLARETFSMIGKNKRLFLGLGLTYALLIIVFSSVLTQDSYTEIKEAAEDITKESGMGAINSTLTLFWSVLTSQFSGAGLGGDGSSYQIMGILFGVYAWLATLWLARSVYAGKKIKVRDAIYNSGGPVVAMVVLGIIATIQIIPAAIAVILYGAADASGVFDQTATLMLAGGALVLVLTLTAYWLTSTAFAMIIVTVPGIYPIRAMGMAGDVVLGRRARLLLRLAWILFLMLLLWAIVLLPTILLDGAIKSSMPSLDWLPIVPVVAVTLMALTVMIFATYTYLLYRKVIDDDSATA